MGIRSVTGPVHAPPSVTPALLVPLELGDNTMRRPLPGRRAGRATGANVVEVTIAETDSYAAIMEAPDDDAPRLVYADWLLSRGDPRGHIIVNGCERARGRDVPHLNEWPAVESWVKPYERLGGDLVPVLERGFCRQVTFRAKDLLDLGDALDTMPPINWLGISHFNDTTLPRLTSRAPHRYRKVELVAYSTLSGSAVGAWVRAMRLVGLAFHGKENVARTLEGVPLQGLSTLECNYTRIGDTGARLIAEAAAGGSLRCLVLGQSEIGPKGARALAPLVRTLERLEISGTSLGAKGIASLLAEVDGGRLAHLCPSFVCSGGKEGNAAAAVLLSSPAVAHLQTLDLSGWELDREKVEALRCVVQQLVWREPREFDWSFPLSDIDD